ncbi:MFS transporter [Sorangium sp. So ce1000]|uniref:MFS transporter n=1 Tax=Sorangium sp. So ce1000 TaxID=3133325 RepID=UPI003F62023B
MSGLIPRLPGSPAWRRLYGAFVISAVGDEFSRIALFARTYELGGSVSSLVGIGLAQALPSLVLAPVVGALSDRGHKRDYLVVADAARCVLTAAVALVGTVPQAIFVTALLSAFGAVFRPVEASLESDLLSADDIVKVNPVRVATKQLLMIGGPALVGGSLALMSARTALLIDAASYGLSALLLLQLPRDPGRLRLSGGAALAEGLGAQLRDGLRYVGRDGEVRLLFFAYVVLVLLLGTQGPLLFDFVVTALGGGGREFGFLMTGLGVGAVLGSIVLGRWSGLRERGPTVLTAILAIDALALLGFTFARSVVVCSLAMVVMGLISAAFQIIVRSTLQTRPPPELRGRVLGLFDGVQGPLSIASSMALLYLATFWSSAVLLRGAALAELGAALASIALLLSLRRRYDGKVGARSPE